MDEVARRLDTLALVSRKLAKGDEVAHASAVFLAAGHAIALRDGHAAVAEDLALKGSNGVLPEVGPHVGNHLTKACQGVCLRLGLSESARKRKAPQDAVESAACSEVKGTWGGNLNFRGLVDEEGTFEAARGPRCYWLWSWLWPWE